MIFGLANTSSYDNFSINKKELKGAKSILDLNKTYEMLETLGISRIGYKTNYMPGFWYQDTNQKVDFNAQTITELKTLINKRNILKQKGSILILNPVPKKEEIKKNLVDKWIKKSLALIKNKNVSGRDLTPFLIASINKLSNGRSLEANIALIINNSRLAGKIAAA